MQFYFIFKKKKYAFSGEKKNEERQTDREFEGNKKMVILNSPCPLNFRFHHHPFLSSSATAVTHLPRQLPPPIFSSFSISSQLDNNHQRTTSPTTPRIDKSLLDVSEVHSDAELWAAVCLRVRSFYNFSEESFGIQVSLR